MDIGVGSLTLAANERLPAPISIFGTILEELDLWFALVRDSFATSTFTKVQSSRCTFSLSLATIIFKYDGR